MKPHAFSILALLTVTSLANADIITPKSVESSLPASAGGKPIHLIDSSGLSKPVEEGSDTASTVADITHAANQPNLTYVTAASKGRHYFEDETAPILTFVLEGMHDKIDSIIVWNYHASGSTNSVQTFDLAFFSDEEATSQIGSTITGLALAEASIDDIRAQQVFFGDGVKFDGVRAIKMTPTSNYKGNRVGLSEVRFNRAQ